MSTILAPSSAPSSSPGLSSAGVPRPARCPRCGAAFPCGAALPADSPCACAGVGLTPAQRAGLRERYAGCLCLACLRAIERGEALDAPEGVR